MFENRIPPKESSAFGKIGFTLRFRALLNKKAPLYTSRDATVEEIKEFSASAHTLLPRLAPDGVLFHLRKRNPSIFQVILEKAGGRVVGLNAQLPLTQVGLGALLSGEFNPACPRSEFVARPHEKVESIYAWLVFSPRNYVATVAGLVDYVERYAPHGCSVFCRAYHERAASLFTECGYEKASIYYPGAPDDLLVVMPLATPGVVSNKQNEPHVKIDIVRSLDDFLKVLSVRASTYIAEQDCPFAEDYDGNDFCASHVLAQVDGEPVGCLRIRYFKDFVKFERLAVRAEFRTSKIAFRIVRMAMRFIAQKGFDRVYGHARHDLVRFWETFGFRPIPGRPKFVFSDIEFVEMEGPVRPVNDVVTVGKPPHHILRPEGKWDEPSIFERPVNLERFAKVAASLGRRRA